MQANRQIQNYQAFVLFKKRKTARASGLIRRTPAFFSAIFLVRLLHAPISRAVRRKTAAAAEIVRPSGDKVHRPPRARVKASFAVSLVCLIAANFFLGTFSQPIIEAIRAGLNMFA